MNPITEELVEEFERRGDSIARVRELHGPGLIWCRECDRLAPCPTIRALDGTDE
jgi:hypothetical protein